MNTPPTTTTAMVHELLHSNTNHSRAGVAIWLFCVLYVGHCDVVPSTSNHAGSCVISWNNISTCSYLTASSKGLDKLTVIPKVSQEIYRILCNLGSYYHAQEMKTCTHTSARWI